MLSWTSQKRVLTDASAFVAVWTAPPNPIAHISLLAKAMSLPHPHRLLSARTCLSWRKRTISSYPPKATGPRSRRDMLLEVSRYFPASFFCNYHIIAVIHIIIFIEIKFVNLFSRFNNFRALVRIFKLIPECNDAQPPVLLNIKHLLLLA